MCIYIYIYIMSMFVRVSMAYVLHAITICTVLVCAANKCAGNLYTVCTVWKFALFCFSHIFFPYRQHVFAKQALRQMRSAKP